MTNNRVYYPVVAAGLAKMGSATYTPIHGLQSIGITTTFNLEQIFEIGQLAIYENIENIPDVECTLEKVLDGYPLAYHLATRGSVGDSLANKQNQRSSLAMSIFGDTQDSASGTPVSEVELSGLYVSSLSYTFPVDGNCTESLTLVGNNKVWRLAGYTFSGSLFDNEDEPLALTSGDGGVQRRENVIFGTVEVSRDANGMVAATDATILPIDIPGISSSGTNFPDANGVHPAHVQTITVSVDLGRDQLLELGKRGPYFRFANFPTEVTCAIEVLDSAGDQVDANEDSEANLADRSIRVFTQDGTFLNLGTKNKLASVTWSGADAAGGNATSTFNFSEFNVLVVSHPQNPG